MRNGGLRKVFPLLHRLQGDFSRRSSAEGGVGQPRTKLASFLLLLFLSLFLFLIDNFGWISGVRGVVQESFLFLERPIYLINQSFSNSVKSVTSRNTSEQIIELQTQLRQLAIDQNQLSTCLEENEHLKKLLGAPLSSEWKFKMARVVGVAEKMKIDLGVRDGVEEGMTVVAENIYLGKVVSVGQRDSLVQLATDPNSKIPVVVKQPASPASQGGPGSSGAHARGLLVGQFGGKLVLDKVLQEEDIRQGDLVMTSGEEGYLSDLVIGQIKEVLKGTAEIYQQAVVSPLIEYNSLRFVFLVIP